EILRRLGWLEREGRQKSRAIGVACGDDLQLIEVGKSWLDAIVTLAQDVVVHQPHPSDICRGLGFVEYGSGSQRVEQPDERGVRSSRAWRWTVAPERRRFPRRCRHCVDRGAGGRISDSWKQEQQAIPAYLVARILEDAQERQYIFDVCRFEKFQPAPFLERDLSIRQLDLEISGHVAGTEEHGDLAQTRSFLVQLQNAIDNELRLLLLVTSGDEPRCFTTSPLRPKILGESLGSARDQSIRNAQNGLRGPVVLLERNHRRAGKLPGKVENVSEVGAAKRVD